LWNASGWLGQLLKTLDLEELRRKEAKMVSWAGHPLRIAMPDRPIDAALLYRTRQPVADMWNFHAEASAYPPQLPPLLQRLPDSPAPPSHISVTQLADLGRFRFGTDAKKRHEAGLRFREKALHDLPPRTVPLKLRARRVSQRQIGAIVHELLRQKAFQLQQEPTDELIEAVAWQRGVSDATALAGVLENVRRLLDKYARSEVCGWIKQARVESRPVFTELPFILLWRDRVIHGAMDVLLLGADGVWRIIDYKTGDVGGNWRSHARQYRLQLGVYAAAVQEQLGLGEPPRTYVHFLRHNRTVQLDYADCQVELERLEATLSEAIADHG